MWHIFDYYSGEWFTVGSYGQPEFATKNDQIRFIRYISNFQYDGYRIHPSQLVPIKD